MRNARRQRGIKASRARAFTLTELMIAVAVFIAVLLAVGKIFSTTSKVTGYGAATADILQEAAAIERQIRSDFERLSYDGFFAIRCVAIPNDIHWSIARPRLLNPSLHPEAVIRCDQLVFFVNGTQSVQTFRVGPYGSAHKGQGTASRIYYGHAFQLGDSGKPVDTDNLPDILAHDPYSRVYPWTDNDFDLQQINMGWTYYDSSDPDDVFTFQPADPVRVGPVDARRWLMARQPVILVDDDSYLPDQIGKTRYLDQVLSAYSIFMWEPLLGNNLQIFHGRVDAAATQLNDVRRMILYVGADLAQPRSWLDQHFLIADQLVYYPRAERYPPSMHRVDQALTNHILSSACSSIQIDWTWEDGTGEVRDDMGVPLVPGLQLETDPDLAAGSQSNEHPWFGMPYPALLLADIDNIRPDYERGVGAYGDMEYRDVPDDQGNINYIWAETIPPIADTNYLNNVERVYTPPGSGIAIYEAIFGYNQDTPLQTDPADPDYGNPDLDMGYTPWPSAVRITLTLHDARGKLEAGREVQFVVRLPERPVDLPRP